MAQPKPQGQEVTEVSDHELVLVSGGGFGSRSTDAGTGDGTPHPLSITRKIDCASPKLLDLATSGKPFSQ
jgi:type VI protein secretion system component Hcp